MMPAEQTENNQTIEQVEALLDHLKNGETSQAEDIFSCISISNHNADVSAKTPEPTSGLSNDLFSEIGKLTRELHDALNSFKLDPKISDLAAHDVPDAKDQLEYVIKMTDDAANKTMDAVDSSLVMTGEIRQSTKDLLSFWERVQRKEISPGEFKIFFEQIGTFLNKVDSDSETMNTLMNDVLMAQGFQDLTGQVIKRVITLVKDVEESLVHTIKMFGQMDQYKSALVEEKAPEEGPQGPAIDAETREDVVSNQDDVDDLLSSLGF